MIKGNFRLLRYSTPIGWISGNVSHYIFLPAATSESTTRRAAAELVPEEDLMVLEGLPSHWRGGRGLDDNLYVEEVGWRGDTGDIE